LKFKLLADRGLFSFGQSRTNGSDFYEECKRHYDNPAINAAEADEGVNMLTLLGNTKSSSSQRAGTTNHPRPNMAMPRHPNMVQMMNQNMGYPYMMNAAMVGPRHPQGMIPMYSMPYGAHPYGAMGMDVGYNPGMNAGMNPGMNANMNAGMNIGMNANMNAGMNIGMGMNAGTNAGMNAGMAGMGYSFQMPSNALSFGPVVPAMHASSTLSSRPQEDPQFSARLRNLLLGDDDDFFSGAPSSPWSNQSAFPSNDPPVTHSSYQAVDCTANKEFHHETSEDVDQTADEGTETGFNFQSLNNRKTATQHKIKILNSNPAGANPTLQD
jgi:hypothetical protein